MHGAVSLGVEIRPLSATATTAIDARDAFDHRRPTVATYIRRQAREHVCPDNEDSRKRICVNHSHSLELTTRPTAQNTDIYTVVHK